MDQLDAKLLEILQNDSRITISALSKALSLSRPSVAERMLRLQEKGVIEEFTTRISMPAIGRDTILLIQLGSIKVSRQEIEDMFLNEADILECHRVTGHFDYSIKAAVSGISGMHKLIDRLMPYGDVNTSVVLLSPVSYRHISIKDMNVK